VHFEPGHSVKMREHLAWTSSTACTRRRSMVALRARSIVY
jgi:hypothetical protein